MRFSIVTPSFRHGEWLRLCVASVADQGVEHEHIVQDAGSDDGTLDWLRADKRVRVFVEPDEGMYDGINRGLRRSTGEILAYLNCDEQYLPGALLEVGSFFDEHPEVDVLFANAIVVEAEGSYLFHRKVLTPLRWHTRVWPLSTLTCATFFRRSVLDVHKCFFDVRYRCMGDGEWVWRLLEHGVRMASLGHFTSAFAHTGGNLGYGDPAKAEFRAWAATAPAWLRGTRWLWLLHHRLRRLAGGIYFQNPFDYAIYTRGSPNHRKTFHVAKPEFRWRL
ncbi:MAG: glycosyltransferase [Verrucomicrobia bacterium]|nr:glycosyltransferase [Verrucomicrobiota bacterium]